MKTTTQTRIIQLVQTILTNNEIGESMRRDALDLFTILTANQIDSEYLLTHDERCVTFFLKTGFRLDIDTYSCIQADLAGGRSIKGIKALCEATDMRLIEAKEVCENPDFFAQPE